MHGGPVEVRRGFLFVPTRFSQNGRTVDPDSAKERLRNNPRSSADMDSADTLRTAANVAAVVTWVAAAWQVTDGFGQGTGGHETAVGIAAGAAFVGWLGFGIGADGELVSAGKAYNRAFLPRRPAPDSPSDLALPPPPRAPGAQPTPAPPAPPPPSPLQVERGVARASEWLSALQQRSAELLAAQMEPPVTFRGVKPDEGENREACAPGKDPAKVLNIRVTDAEGLAKVVGCLLSDSALMSALAEAPVLVKVRPLAPDRLAGSLLRFATRVKELPDESLVFELHHAERDVTYGFLAVRKAEGDEVGLVSAVIIARSE